MTEYRVSSILSGECPTVTADTPIRQAVSMLTESGADAAAVLADDGGLIGILTQKDCFRPALHAAYYQEWTGCVGDHMSRNVITVGLNEEVIRSAKMFLTHTHRVFPVLDGTRIAGLLRRSDVLSLLAQLG